MPAPGDSHEVATLGPPHSDPYACPDPSGYPHNGFWEIAGRHLDLLARPLLMGIVNVTPDSFSDGGRCLEPADAVAHAHALAQAGADIIDLGGESSRPGAAPVSEHEELRRLLPVIEALRTSLDIPLSVDTTKSRVARLALEAGASIINDISALRFDRDMGRVVAEHRAGIVLMHMQGTPMTMQEHPRYEHVVNDVHAFFEERLAAAASYGIPRSHIVLDPGIGFGKTLAHNVSLLTHLEAFQDFGRPILVGISRKAFIGQLTGRPIGERLIGSVAAATAAILRGARILRVHDVAALQDAVAVAAALRTSPSLG